MSVYLNRKGGVDSICHSTDCCAGVSRYEHQESHAGRTCSVHLVSLLIAVQKCFGHNVPMAINCGCIRAVSPPCVECVKHYVGSLLYLCNRHKWHNISRLI